MISVAASGLLVIWGLANFVLSIWIYSAWLFSTFIEKASESRVLSKTPRRRGALFAVPSLLMIYAAFDPRIALIVCGFSVLSVLIYSALLVAAGGYEKKWRRMIWVDAIGFLILLAAILLSLL